MNQRALSRRIRAMTKRDKLDAFLHYAFEVWSGREPSRVGPSGARTLAAEALQKARQLGFTDLDREYTPRWEAGQGGTRTYRSQVAGAFQNQRRLTQEQIRNTVNINVASWPFGTLSSFSRLMNPNTRNSIFSNEDVRRPMITAFLDFFVGVAQGTIHSAECRITPRNALFLMQRLRDVCQYYGLYNLNSLINRRLIEMTDLITTRETNDRLQTESTAAQVARNAKRWEGVRLIRFPKKKKEETLENIEPKQLTIDDILLGDDDDW